MAASSAASPPPAVAAAAAAVPGTSEFPPAESHSHSHSHSRAPPSSRSNASSTVTGGGSTPTRSYSTRSSRHPVPHSSVASSSAATATSSNHYRNHSSTNGNAHEGTRSSSQSHSRGHHQSQRDSQASHQHHNHHHRRPSSSTRSSQHDAAVPVPVPHNDYETSHLASYPKRSASRDRPPPSRAPDSSRSHRRSTSRSNSQHHSHSQHHRSHPADMPPSATANNGTSAANSHTAGDPSHSSSKQSRSRTIIPTQSGKWILGKLIGAGSMGKVKLARKEDGSEQAACKIIPRGSADDSHQNRSDKDRADQSKEIRTAREAAIVTLLNHPYICGMRDFVRTNYHWYMLFEYVNGGQMLDYIISHGKLKEKQARKFSRQIASALDYCHRNSIVHRDLKIENILISKNGDIKIIDFGLSNLFAPRGHLKTFCGSLYFAAPELLQAKEYTGPEVDIWSFGIVLYVLVCGRVPFDDQSMPALHAKIKKGAVDYPNWLSKECEHLISRMLVTDPTKRATMQEVMTHPWMNKGFNGPPDNHVPQREPLSTPLEPEVIAAMHGFNFGTPEHIRSQLTSIIESAEYQRAVRLHQREKEATPQPIKESERKRGFGFDFYKRRNSQNSRDTLTGPSSEALQLGSDPLNAFSPLLSVYYLVKEKQERETADRAPPPTAQSREKEKEREREREKEKEKEREVVEREREREREKDRDRDRPREREQNSIPDIAPPAAAHTNATAYEMPGEKPTGGRTRPRARTHGEDDAPEIAKPPAHPESKPVHSQKKEGGAAGILRRFSTRKRREPERLERDRSHPPVVQVHSPAETPTLAPRKSFSIRRGRREQTDSGGELRLRAGSSQPQHGELLSPPMSAGAGARDSRRSGLGRSTSVNSGDNRRRDTGRLVKDPPATSGSDQSVITEQPSVPQRGHAHSQSMAMRTKSLGHARRESIQQRRQRREASQQSQQEPTNVPEETDQEQDQSGVSTERLDSSDLAKPVFLKGLFSVSTTSGKSVTAIRAEIRRVLRQLNVEYVEIKGGFSCKHSPSIDLNKIADPPTTPAAQTPGHKRRFSFGGLRRGEGERDDDRPPMTPRTPGRSDRDHSYSNSDASTDSIPPRTTGPPRRAPGETSTQVQSDLGGNMVLEFEIFIVKVPILSLHGIQFKRMEGNTWQFKNMADQVLKEVRL